MGLEGFSVNTMEELAIFSFSPFTCAAEIYCVFGQSWEGATLVTVRAQLGCWAGQQGCTPQRSR